MTRTEDTEILELFEEFYSNYYRSEIGDLAQKYPDEKKSLYVDWQDIYRFDPNLGEDFLNHPNQYHDYAEEALQLYELPVDVKLSEANVRLTNLHEVTEIPDIRTQHLGQVISIVGVVRSTSEVISTLTTAAFECQRCGIRTRIPQLDSPELESPEEPRECQGCERTGPFRIDYDFSEMVDAQKIRIESHPAGSTTDSPESIVAIVKDDIVEEVEPGNRLRVTGRLTMADVGSERSELDATINDKYLHGESFEDLKPGDILDITEKDKQKIVGASEDSDVFEQIVNSIAPHVPGNEELKLAVALQLFSGVKKRLPDETVIPGTIHVAVVSDPGMFAAEIAGYASHLAPTSVSVDGTDTTQVGLTSAAYKSSSGTKNWELDAGALVLADGGIACITRADELRKDASAALNSVMRDQEVKASKGTVTRTLSAETSVFATMQPKWGRFDRYEPISEQFDMEPGLVSQFDLLFALTDSPDENEDRDHAERILTTNYVGEVNTHQKQTSASDFTEEQVLQITEEVAPTIGADLLRKYIAYSKRNVFPTMTDEAKEEIREFYVNLRSKGAADDAPVPVSAKKLESLVRLAEASARIRLSETVEQSDVERVIELVQSCLEDIGMDPEMGELDEDVIETGTSSTQRKRIKNLKALIADIQEEYDVGVPLESVFERAKEAGMKRSKVEHEIDKLKDQGEVYEPRKDVLRTT